MKEILVVQTGIANVASLSAAFSRLGYKVVLSDSIRPECRHECILGSEYVVLPGVGAFAAGMKALRSQQLVNALFDRIRSGRATLAVCLGLQILFEGSEESPGIGGLGVYPGVVKKLDSHLPLPHLSWNKVSADRGFSSVKSSWAYFAHSYAAAVAPKDSEYLVAEYGTKFVAGFRIGRILACQFHPELSSRFGHKLLKEWIS